jgi:hypothetical protein
MLKPGENHFVLKKCIEILEAVRSFVEKYGFDLKRDGHLLTKLYGTDIDGVPPLKLLNWYHLLAAAREAEGEEKTADPSRLKRIVLLGIDNEIGRVSALEKAVRRRERKRSNYKVDQSLILPQEALDLDMRHDAHFTRDLARKLSLYEYAQRMGTGLPGLPPVKVEV